MKLSMKLFAATLIMSHAALLWKLFSQNLDVPNRTEAVKTADKGLVDQDYHYSELTVLSDQLEAMAHQMQLINKTIASLHVNQTQYKTQDLSTETLSD
jgi:hypothetical protein